MGKTTAVAAALEGERGRNAVWLTFGSRPTMPKLRTALWAQLWPGIRLPRSRTDFEHGVTRAFERSRRVLVCGFVENSWLL
ncbi:hypothetical protein [Embleya sp. AB8]|uniref:hypothetical protein n=1 Tax=Embleya sp. AB8 TaxID=3156304 RepID=UPI003C72C861